MPQRKPPLRYLSEAHLVYGEVQRHFQAKNIELPQDWESLVACACFPAQVAEQTYQGGWGTDSMGKRIPLMDKQTPLKEKWQVVTNSFARQPDLTLEILVFARCCINRYDESKCLTQDGVVRAFLLKYGSSILIKETDGFRKPTGDEARKIISGRGKGINFIPVSKMTDGEIAQHLTTPGGLDITTEMVKKVRQSLSVEVVKRSLIVIPVNQLTDTEFASYVESDAQITPDILKELRLFTPFISLPIDGLKHKGNKEDFKSVLVNQLKEDELVQAFRPARITPEAVQGLRLWDAFIRLPIAGKKRKGRK